MLKRLKILLKFFFSIIIIAPISFVIYLNSSLYYSPTIVHNENGTYNQDVYYQLSYLKQRRLAGASHEMQDLFPEGLIFFASNYGLAWINFIKNLNPKSSIFQEGLKEINWSIKESSSETSKNVFYKDHVTIEYGIFYNGWNALLLGKKIKYLPIVQRDSIDEIQFKNYCYKMAKAFRENENPFLESYVGSSWPSDATVAISSLALHDKIYQPKYQKLIQMWLTKAKQRLDQRGLVPHKSDYKTGQSLESAKGISQALILIHLLEIDEEFAQKQYELFKKHFVETRLGLRAIREHPKGIQGVGDIDSGPVIWDIGTAATIVSYRTALAFQDYQLAAELKGGLEMVGFPTEDDHLKKYLFGYLDVDDVFIAWSRSNDLHPHEIENNFWRIGFQLRSLGFILVFVLILYWIWKKRKANNKHTE